LERLGIANISDEAVAEMLDQVKKKGIEKRGLVTGEEFKAIVDSVMSGVA
jgi:hypothetical protein